MVSVSRRQAGRRGRTQLLAASALAIASLFVAAPASAEEIPLNSYIEAALSKNAAQAAAEATLQAQRAATGQARAAARPAVRLGGSADATSGTLDLGDDGDALVAALLGPDGDTALLGGLGTAPARGVELSVTQPLYTGGQIRQGIREADALFLAAEARFEAETQARRLEIAEAALGLATARARVEVTARSLDRLIQQKRATDISFDAGQATGTDVALADARVAATDAALAFARQTEASLAAAVQALGGDPQATLALQEAALPVPDTIDDALLEAQRTNPALRAADEAMAASMAALKAARGRRAPNVQLVGSLSYAENSFIEGDRSEAATLTAEASIPLFEGGAIRSAIAEAAAADRARKHDRREVSRQVEASVRSAFAEVIAAQAQRRATTLQLEALELAFRGVQLERELGQRSVLDVLDVEEDLLAARLADLEAHQAEILATFRLRQAMGTLRPGG